MPLKRGIWGHVREGDWEGLIKSMGNINKIKDSLGSNFDILER
jgi:hypothetical protein